MYKYLFLSLLSFSAFAEQEINLSYSRINQDLEFSNRIELDMDAASLSYSYFMDNGLGAEILISRSLEAENSIVLDDVYSNKINALWSISGVYKYELNDSINLKVGAGLTEYHSTWKVNGDEPTWSKGTDSYKPSWFVGLQYELYDDIYLEFSRRFMYEKYKANRGREVTYAYNIGITYLF